MKGRSGHRPVRFTAPVNLRAAYHDACHLAAQCARRTRFLSLLRALAAGSAGGAAGPDVFGGLQAGLTELAPQFFNTGEHVDHLAFVGLACVLGHEGAGRLEGRFHFLIGTMMSSSRAR